MLAWLYDTSFGRLNRAYDRLLVFFLGRRVELVVSLVLVFLVTAGGPWSPMQKVKFVSSQEEERSGFWIDVEMPASNTLEETEAWFLEAERIVESKKEELDLGGWFHFHRQTGGEIQGWFNQPRTKNITAKEATKIVVDALPEKPGMKLVVAEDRNKPNEPDSSVWSLTLHGEDIELLDRVADELQEALVNVKGVLGLRGSDERAANELALVIDRDRAQRYGVNPRVVAGVVGYALRGTPLPRDPRAGPFPRGGPGEPDRAGRLSRAHRSGRCAAALRAGRDQGHARSTEHHPA
jgi:HAE1 family hydrophobic/amphiphilic exporter-1